jgi:hypothetical protein
MPHGIRDTNVQSIYFCRNFCGDDDKEEGCILLLVEFHQPEFAHNDTVSGVAVACGGETITDCINILSAGRKYSTSVDEISNATVTATATAKLVPKVGSPVASARKDISLPTPKSDSKDEELVMACFRIVDGGINLAQCNIALVLLYTLSINSVGSELE